MAPPFAQQTKKTTTQSSTSGGPPGLTSSRRAGPPAPPGKSGAEILKDLNREITRKTYFDGRQDISDDRLDRRLQQAEERKDFIEQYTKPVYTESGSVVKGLRQAKNATYFDTDSSSPTFGQYVTTTLADKEMQLANKYGPTFSEMMSDVTYAGGKVLGAVGERAMSGGLGFLGAIKDVANYALDKANQGYDKLNAVQQEVFDNPDKYPYASKVPQVEAVNNSRLLALEAMRDANSYAADATGILGVDQNRLDGFVNEPIDTFGTAGPTVDMRKPTEERIDPIDIDGSYVESGQFKSDLEKSGIITVDDLDTQEPLPDSTKIPGYNNVTIGMLKEDLKKRNFNDFQITGIINEMTQRIISGEDVNAPYENIEEPEKSDDQVSFTPYNNPMNLEFRGQEGAEPGYGGEEGTRFASFDTLDQGLTAGINRVAEIVGEGKSTNDFLNTYAPRSDNPESYDNYLATLRDKVGETIEPNEIKSLTEGVVKFENKPELADQYLNYLVQEKDKLYSGIVS